MNPALAIVAAFLALVVIEVANVRLQTEAGGLSVASAAVRVLP